MFNYHKVERLNIPQWEAVYRAELVPGVISFIAIHDTSRGCALGGCRMANYNDESLALTDVLRLSRGMTYKNTVSDLPLGGGKSVIICDPTVVGKSRENIFKEFGKFVAWINRDENLYSAAEDMNTTVDDMKIVNNYTSNIFGTKIDPSPYTAYGVYYAIEYVVDYFSLDLFHGERTLEGKRILLQGVGKVGLILLGLLIDAGMEVYVNDIIKDRVRSTKKKYSNIKVVCQKDLFNIDVDIFSPAARGEIITQQNVDNCKFKILCGPANNQLQNHEAGELLHKSGIIYCPDYVVNMGGVCSIKYLEIDGLSTEVTLKKIKQTVRKMLALTFRTAIRKNLSFNIAVDHAVRKILRKTHADHREVSNSKIFPLTSASLFS